MSGELKKFLNNLEPETKSTDTLIKASPIVKITFEGTARHPSYMACNSKTNKWWFRIGSGANGDWVPSRYTPNDWVTEFNKGYGDVIAWWHFIGPEELPGAFPDWTT